MTIPNIFSRLGIHMRGRPNPNDSALALPLAESTISKKIVYEVAAKITHKTANIPVRTSNNFLFLLNK
ncbi:hypothetical protein [Desulfovibrio sp. UCD-KL4C]|uniref:hypothetical protein n=1 Tax=Desulfovibrio sp. UCD-KL4C TaxID=2578120 RepID=UPI0025BFFD9E|nr:hypothetical protein [Desulfovibrio sp. UCD-KL4C]